MKRSADTVCSTPSPSKYWTADTWPPSFTSFLARQLTRTWQRLVRSAFKRAVTGGDPLELFGHPLPLHGPQSTHGGRLSRKREFTQVGYVWGESGAPRNCVCWAASTRSRL